MMRLSIVTVGYNSRRDLDRLLASLTQPPPAAAHEIVIVDNASSDATSSFLREQWPKVRVIEAGGNVGFARANNLAIARTTGDLLLFLNPDTIVPAGVIDRLIAIADAHPEVAIVGPRIVDDKGRAELSFGAMMTPWGELVQKVLVQGNDLGLWPCVPIVDRRTRRGRTVDWVSGACLLIRRTALEAAGGFDERFFMYAEDVDLCAAVRAQGGTVQFTPEVEIVHLRGRSAEFAPRVARDAHRRSQLAFYAKHHPHWLPLLRAYLKIRGRLPDTPP